MKKIWMGFTNPVWIDLGSVWESRSRPIVDLPGQVGGPETPKFIDFFHKIAFLMVSHSLTDHFLGAIQHDLSLPGQGEDNPRVRGLCKHHRCIGICPKLAKIAKMKKIAFLQVLDRPTNHFFSVNLAKSHRGRCRGSLSRVICL